MTRLLLALFTILFFTACAPISIQTVKKDLEKNNFKMAMYNLEKIRKIHPDEFAIIYGSVVTKLSLEEAKTMLNLSLKRGANINSNDSDKLSLMDHAQHKNDIPLLNYLLEVGFVPSNTDSLFTYALDNNHTDFSNHLFDLGFTYSKATADFNTAVSLKEYDKAAYWLKHGADVNNDHMILRAAIDADDLELANFLLDHNYNINEDTQLLTYVIKSKNVKYMTLLLASNYNINSDKTLLSYIVKQPDYPLADYLIDNGAAIANDPNLFAYAANKKDYILMRYLIKHGAEANFAAEELEKAFKENNLAFAQLLMEMGVTLTNGRTPLTYCAMLHNKKAMQTLIKKGARINQKDHFGRTALMYVADDSTLTDWLVHQGADVNARDTLGRTTLMYAIASTGIVKDLLVHGADPKVKDNADLSLLSYAISNNNMNVVKLLVEDKKLAVNYEDQWGHRPLNFSNNIKLTRYLMKHNARH